MKKGELVTGKISSMAFGGKGIIKHEDSFVIFVENGILGQCLEVRIHKKKKSYAEAKITRIIESSPFEQEHPYQATPGAPWISLPLQKQVEIKREQVFDLFLKFARIDLNLFVDEVSTSPQPWFYRNKMEYSFGPTDESYTEDKEEKKIWSHTGFGLGSKKRGQFWLVENLEKPSGLFDKDLEKSIQTIRQWCEDTNLPVYNQRTHTGFWRYFVVRKSFAEDKFLLNIVTNKDTENIFDTKAFTEFLTKLPWGDRIQGITWTQSTSVGDTTTRYESREQLFGQDRFTEYMSELAFEVSLDSFFQPNIFSAEKIYAKVGEYVSVPEGGKVFDLFCGTGTIGQIIAKQHPNSEVIGVDIVESSIENARKNAERNNLTNVTFYANDAGKWMKEHPELTQNIHTIIVDPPRAGIGPKSLEKIIGIQPQNIIYVSCNPATQARDVSTLKEAGYKLEKCSLIDQFPHTPHVECIAKLSR